MIVTNLALKRSLILDNIFLSKTSYSYQLMDQVLTLNIYLILLKILFHKNCIYERK